MTSSQREAIDILLEMDDVTVNADLIAPCMSMNPGTLRKHVKDGFYITSKFEYNPETGRIRFYRKDFLQKIGELPEDPPERTDSDRLEDIIRLLDEMNDLLHAIIKPPAAATTDG